MIAIMKVVLLLSAFAVISVRATSEPIPFCTGNLEIYPPCKCKRMYENWVHLVCTHIDGKEMMEVFDRVIGDGKVITSIKIENPTIRTLPDRFFAVSKPIIIELVTPKLESLEPIVMEGTEGNLDSLTIKGGSLAEVPISTYSLLTKVKDINLLDMPNIKSLKREELERLSTIHQIESFHLTNAAVSEIENGTFSKFISLKSLSLEGNPISEFSLDALPPQNLSGIGLSNTNITRIPVELMTKMDGTGWLSFENLGIVDVEEDWIKMAIKYGTLLNLDKNPLHCGSSMCVMIEQLQKDRYDYDILGHCDSPPRLYGKWLPSLINQNITCLEE